MSSAEPGPGRVVADRYELTAELGRGGMGVVWRATDRVLGREVALKEITFPLHVSAEEREVLRERTRREARAAARLSHPRVIPVHDVVEADGEPWLVMAHVPSRSLQQVVDEDGPLPPATAARIGLDVLDALAAAHAAGIVHRDVKPANVLVGDGGRAWLTDFGIATTTGDPTLTQDGVVLGSPSYMAPERAQGEPPGPPADLWSLGATLYTAVEGRLPFSRGEPMATLLAVVSEPPAPAVAAGGLAPALSALLTKDPAARATAAGARALLEQALSAPEDAAPRPPAPGPPTHPPAPPASGSANRLERFDREQLGALAAASREALSSVASSARVQARDVRHLARDQARDVRHLAVDQARGLAQRRREPTGADAARPAEDPGGRPSRRWRFKRRWVVVPALVALVVLAAVLTGVVLLLHAAGVL